MSGLIVKKEVSSEVDFFKPFNAKRCLCGLVFWISGERGVGDKFRGSAGGSTQQLANDFQVELFEILEDLKHIRYSIHAKITKQFLVSYKCIAFL